MKQFILILLLTATPALAAETWNHDLAENLVQLSIRCVDKESPHSYDFFGGAVKAKAMHPVFYGCYDWHSAVHGHWAMLRSIHTFPDLPSKATIRSTLARKLKPELIAGEVQQLKKEPMFERTYGWAWLLRLAAEFKQTDPDEKKWAEALRPLEMLIRQNFMTFLPKLVKPFRDGFHPNTAFSLIHAIDYARAKNDAEFEGVIQETAMRLYDEDRNCPIAYEPSGGDFHSPCFTEAALMARVMEKQEFQEWWKKFMPRIPAIALKPVIPKDLKDPILAHLIGLMFFKSWCMEQVAHQLPRKDKTAALLRKAAVEQADTALKLMFDAGYGGEHWLASFAIFRFTE